MFAGARPRGQGTARERSASNVMLICNCFTNKVHIEMFIKIITLFYWSASYKKWMTISGMVYIY